MLWRCATVACAVAPPPSGPVSDALQGHNVLLRRLERAEGGAPVFVVAPDQWDAARDSPAPASSVGSPQYAARSPPRFQESQRRRARVRQAFRRAAPAPAPEAAVATPREAQAALDAQREAEYAQDERDQRYIE